MKPAVRIFGAVAFVCIVVLIAFGSAKNGSYSKSPMENDRLIAKYKASNDPAQLQPIFESFARVDSELLGDARRLAYLQNMSKQPNNPRRQGFPVAAKTVCAKYNCEGKTEKARQIFTVSSGISAIESLSLQDDKVRALKDRFLEKHKDVRAVFAAEDIALNNYRAMVVATIAGAETDSMLLKYEEMQQVDWKKEFESLKK